MHKIKFNVITLVMIILVLSACSTANVKKTFSSEESVKNRASERWAFLIQGRLESAYQYQSPEYRQLFDFKHFRKKIRGVGLWSKAEVLDVICTEKCIATVKVYVTMRPGRWGDVVETDQIVKEQWVRNTDTNEWFYLSNN